VPSKSTIRGHLKLIHTISTCNPDVNELRHASFFPCYRDWMIKLIDTKRNQTNGYETKLIDMESCQKKGISSKFPSCSLCFRVPHGPIVGFAFEYPWTLPIVGFAFESPCGLQGLSPLLALLSSPRGLFPLLALLSSPCSSYGTGTLPLCKPKMQLNATH